MVAWAIYPDDGVRLTRGALTTYASSPGVERGFCARCGGSLTYRRANRPGLFDITLGSLDEPERLAPLKEIWVDERLPWVAPRPDLPQFPGSSAAGAAPPPGA